MNLYLVGVFQKGYRVTFVVVLSTRLSKVSEVLYSKVGINGDFNRKLIADAFSTLNATLMV